MRFILRNKVVLEKRPTPKEELKKMSELSPSQLIWYIWQYYKFHIAAIICVIGLVIMIAMAVINARKEVLVSGIVLNVSHYSPENPRYLQDTYLQFAGKTEKEANLDVRTDLSIEMEEGKSDLISAYSLQVFTTLLSGNTQDFIICNPDTIDYVQKVSGGVLADMSKVLSAETYSRMEEEDRLYEVPQMIFHDDGTASLGEETFPVAIDISDSHLCRGLGIPEENTIYLCFLSNSPTPEHFEEIITYLFDFEVK